MAGGPGRAATCTPTDSAWHRDHGIRGRRRSGRRLVLLQPSDDRAVSRSTGLTELMVPPALTAAEPVPEQPLSLAEMLLGRGPDAADLTDLEELLLRPGPRVFSPAAGDASEPSWWIVLRSGTEQPQ
jgi:hypothetical protein